MVQRHAEIAGGGIGGLGLGMMLASRGWSVRVHERSPEIRELGAGIYIKNNSLEVLEKYGVVAELAPHDTWLEHRRIRDQHGKLLEEHATTGRSRCIVLPRQALVDALARAARAAGVEVVTGSRIMAAQAEGVLVDEAGRSHRGDLVVCADGYRSALRTSLGIASRWRDLGTLINRYLVETRSFTQEAVTTEHWSGQRRIGITPSGPNQSYVYVVMPARDEGARRLPLDLSDWGRSHPFLMRQELPILAAEPATQRPYSLVECSRWHVGRAAVIGDAAHGLPPTLGQGAGLTLMNSHALARLVSEREDIPAALQEWERTVRFISDATQRWAVRYDRFTRQWPPALNAIRPLIVAGFSRSRYLTGRLRIADHGLAQTALGGA